MSDSLGDILTRLSVGRERKRERLRRKRMRGVRRRRGVLTKGRRSGRWRRVGMAT
jgi:hypothetical protein